MAQKELEPSTYQFVASFYLESKDLLPEVF